MNITENAFGKLLIFMLAVNVLTVMCSPSDLSQLQGPEDSIAKYRKGIIEVRAKRGDNVTIEQVRHEFWFGCAIPNGIGNGKMAESDMKMFKQKFLENFNAAVTENAVKWGTMEPRRGEVNYSITDGIGNSEKRLNEPNIIPIFVGILLGVLLGSIPFHIPGITNPVKLGLAGGPLIIAILLSRYGYKFSLVAYTTPSANLMLREIGIVLFLASVGLTAGEKFVPALKSGDGLLWLGYGALITLTPILVVGAFARHFMKKNYIEICGLLSGSMTDPPALAFANSVTKSEAPAVAYATVYPLVMFMRIFVAQLLILFFL